MSVVQAVVYNIFFLVYFLCQVYSESYEKLLIVKDVWRPGVVKFHETYYLVDDDSKMFSSKDLKVWATEKDLVFDNNSAPKWAIDKDIFGPEIHFINEKYNLYFHNLKKEYGWAIGVATADSPVGPYKRYERPLVSIDKGHALGPHIAREGT